MRLVVRPTAMAKTSPRVSDSATARAMGSQVRTRPCEPASGAVMAVTPVRVQTWSAASVAAPRRRRIGLLVAATLVVALAGTGPWLQGPAVAATAAAGAPGVMSHFDLARKDCLGTARNGTSKVWYTVAGGVLSDVYYPTVDTTNVETLQYVVTDGSTFTDLQTRDTTYTVESLDRTGMTCRVTSTAQAAAATRSSPTTSPTRRRDSVVMRTPLKALHGSTQGLSVYARLDATVNGNGGGGTGPTPARTTPSWTHSTGHPVPVSSRHEHRDHRRQPRLRRSRCSRRCAPTDRSAPSAAGTPARRATASPSSTPTTGLTTTDAGRTRRQRRADRAGRRSRHQPAPRSRSASDPPGGCRRHGGRSARSDFAHTSTGPTARAGSGTTSKLRRPVAAGLSRSERRRARAHLLRVRERAQGQRGQDVPRRGGRLPGQPLGAGRERRRPAQTYFGSYREVFARDLYETFTGLVAAVTWRQRTDTVRFLFERQQQPDGSMPRNSLVNGKMAPDSFGTQLDEVDLSDPDGAHGRADRQGLLHASTSSAPRTTSSRTGRRSGTSAGRSRAGTRRRRSPPRSPAWPRPARSPRRTATPPAPGSTGPPPTTTSATSRAGR